jgi:plasmid stabilization system protein ParE
MGQSQDLVRPGLRRLDLKRHSIYYIPHDDGVLVVRVLHYRQDAWAHLK